MIANDHGRDVAMMSQIRRKGTAVALYLLIVLGLVVQPAAAGQPTPADEVVEVALESIRRMLDVDGWIRDYVDEEEIPTGAIVSTTEKVSGQATDARRMVRAMDPSHPEYDRALNAAQWAELARWVTAGLLCSGWLVHLVSRFPWHRTIPPITLPESVGTFMLELDPGTLSPRDVGIYNSFYSTENVVPGCGFPSGEWNPPSLPLCSERSWLQRLISKLCRGD